MGIYQRKDSRFWWMVVEATGQRLSTGVPIEGGSPVQNREQERQAQAMYAIAQGKAALAQHHPSPDRPIVSFRTWAAWYDTHHIAHHRGAARERSMLGRLRSYFDRYPSIAQIDEPAVKEWMSFRATQVGKSTVNRELDILKVLFRLAVPKYLPAYPLGGLRRFRVEEHEPRVLTVEEEARILAVCNPIDRAFVLMALDTLLRLSSVVRLKWAQVKLEARAVLPLNAKVATDAKPMSARLYEALQALPDRDGYVFAAFHERTTTGARARAMARFEHLCELAGVPHGRAKGGVTFHCLRHTGASRALQNGASIRTVMKLGGWKNVQTVLRYLHTSDADVIAAAESIGRAHAPLTLVKSEKKQA